MLSLFVPEQCRKGTCKKNSDLPFSFVIQTHWNFKPTSDLVTFGYVHTGMNVIKKIENIDTLEGSRLSKSVFVTDSGLLRDITRE
ncbi:hypothetical protein GZ78_12795 [Endozoicomonas numazuensis]|uniref:PPIase cyclophilin-type domain-containing protein n=1 Tax=Endozoicomonas numazuensis TaxID=1137799 RepID=A0A081NIV2_9GAMM|nr:hypothetical protein GZ78_12795 [Endozoicomonas numazuensis]